MADGYDHDGATTPIRAADTSSHPATNIAVHETQRVRKRLPLPSRIFIGLGVGVIAGLAINTLAGRKDPRVVSIVDNITEPIGQLFLLLLLMSVIPLVFSSLAVRVA